jgi:simple sugar transport system permease protein
MKRLIPSVIAFAAGLLTIALLIVASSPNPAVPLATFFAKPFSSWWYVGNTLNMAGLLILAGAGSAFALRTGTFNLGGEAQIYAPALVTATILAQGGMAAGSGGTTATAMRFAVALVAAAGTGALLGFIPGILKSRFRITEILSSFLLSAAITPVIDYLVAGPLRDKGKNLLATPPIEGAFRLPPVATPSYFNASFFVAVAVALCAGFFLSRTRAGYRFRVAGTAPEFARFAGFPVSTASVSGMTVSGALHGLAGFFAVTGTWYACLEGFSSGMGWSALAIALIAGQNVLAVIPAAVLYAWLETASDAAVLSTGFSFDSTSLMQAVIFLVISAQTLGWPRLREYFLRRERKGGKR